MLLALLPCSYMIHGHSSDSNCLAARLRYCAVCAHAHTVDTHAKSPIHRNADGEFWRCFRLVACKTHGDRYRPVYMVTHVNYRLTGQESRWTVTHFALLQAGTVYIDGRKQVLEKGGCQLQVLLTPKVVHHDQRGVLHMATITCHQQVHVGLSAHCQVFASVLHVRPLVSVCHM